MREAFYEYYELSDKDADKLWKEGLIVFDTNVILSLYRLSKEAREEILSVMNSYKSRIWLPQQVGYEYHENRLDKATAPVEAIRTLQEKVDGFENTIKNTYSTNPYIDYKKLDVALKRLKNKVAKLTEEWLDNCPNMIREDSVLKSLTQLFEGKIGDGYEDDKLNDIYKLGSNRYDNKIPPGYKDTQKKNGDRHRFGDFIIWLQIMEQSKKEN